MEYEKKRSLLDKDAFLPWDFTQFVSKIVEKPQCDLHNIKKISQQKVWTQAN